MVSLIGKTIVGRAGFSQSSNLGLTELTANDPEEFISIASTLAVDLPRLSELRKNLRPRMRVSKLCDSIGWVREIEAAYVQAWSQNCGL